MRAPAILAAFALVAACSGEAPPPAPVVPATLVPGEWEVTATVADLAATEKSAPALAAEPGSATTTRACIAADRPPPPELFAAKGDECALQNPYARNGRLNLQLDCTRAGAGKVMGDITGSFTADSMKGSIATTTYFAGPGDYRLRQDFTGRRVGECSPTEASSAP